MRAVAEAVECRLRSARGHLDGVGIMTRDPSLRRAERAPTPSKMAVAILPFLGVAAWRVWLGQELANG
jgi:hypothetical protein